MFIHKDDRWVLSFFRPDDKPINIGPWFAGGAVLNWYLGKPAASDIDVFFPHIELYNYIKKHIEKQLNENKIPVHDPFSDNPDEFIWTNGDYDWQKVETENAVTYILRDGKSDKHKKLQIIKRRFYKNPQEIVEDFDISVCAVAFDGDKLYMSPHFAEDVKTRQFRFYKIDKHSPSRYVKYMAYGYRPIDGTLEKLFEDNSVSWIRSESQYDA